MNHEKLNLEHIWRFFCNRMPVISAAGFGLCWLIYLLLPKRRYGINEFMQNFGNIMGVLVWVCMICGALFVLSLIAYLCSKPLSGQREGLHILLRFLIAVTAIAATLIGVWVTVFIFAGLGY